MNIPGSPFAVFALVITLLYNAGIDELNARAQSIGFTKKTIEQPVLFRNTMIDTVPTAEAEIYIVVPERGAYRTLDISNEWERVKENDALSIEYWQSTGKQNLLEQLRESSVYDVALHFSGYPNTDETEPSNVSLFFPDNEHALAIILSDQLLDDSIRSMEYRLELTKIDGVWNIEWAGIRLRCYRSQDKDWTTGLCP